MSVWSTTDIMTTISTSHSTAPLWIGYIAVVITVFFFGSNLLPARKYPIGDSFSFQFFMCCGIWITGLIIDLFVSKEGHGPPLFSLVLIGGALWATGNILCLLVIRINGIGLSMLLWCTTNLLVGKFFVKQEK
jgi:glucose uptake protein GlcU